MVKQPKSISMDDELIKLIQNLPIPGRENHQQSFSKRVEFMVDSFSKMLFWTKRELDGNFTTEEALVIIEALNGIGYHGASVSPTGHLIGEVSAYMELNNSYVTYKVEKEDLLGKLAKLTAFQSFTLLSMTYEFWELNSDDEENPARDIIDQVFNSKK